MAQVPAPLPITIPRPTRGMGRGPPTFKIHLTSIAGSPTIGPPTSAVTELPTASHASRTR